ncbi:MAG: flagellar biosynthetic protein FliO [Planctomycetes bacterium]|nr:flagellar biosynthetic protein FliO [Planctomycetota bacterium]
MLTTLALLQDLPQVQGPNLTRYFAVLGGVGVVLVLTAIGIRKLVNKGSLGFKGLQRSLEVVDMLPLGSRRHVAVVRCYDRTFAIGLGEKSVSLLAELDADMVNNERRKSPRAGKSKERPSIGGLRSILKPQGQNRVKTQPEASGVTGDSFERLLDQAQQQLDAKRAAGMKSPQTEARIANGGLEELC